jgi:hypothetical protein
LIRPPGYSTIIRIGGINIGAVIERGTVSRVEPFGVEPPRLEITPDGRMPLMVLLREEIVVDDGRPGPCNSLIVGITYPDIRLVGISGRIVR